MGKWSVMSAGMMPERSESEKSMLENILSMSVAECCVIRVGLLMSGDMELAKFSVIKSLVGRWSECLSKSML